MYTATQTSRTTTEPDTKSGRLFRLQKRQSEQPDKLTRQSDRQSFSADRMSVHLDAQCRKLVRLPRYQDE